MLPIKSNRTQILAERYLDREERTHADRPADRYPTPAEMFGSLGVALCAILHMVCVILLFAEVPVH
jgi:hypothetical protein